MVSFTGACPISAREGEAKFWITLYCKAGRNAGFQFYRTLCTGLKGTAKPNPCGARIKVMLANTHTPIPE